MILLLLHIRGQPFTSVLLLRFGETANTSVGVEISSASPGQGSKHVENISEAINHSNNATKPLLLLRSTKKICSNSVRESPFREMIFAKSNQDIILRSRAIGRDSTTSTIGDLEKEATTTYFAQQFFWMEFLDRNVLWETTPPWLRMEERAANYGRVGRWSERNGTLELRNGTTELRNTRRVWNPKQN